MDSPKMALETKTLPFVKKELDKPDINEIVEVLRKGLTNYSEVSVNCVECPDLTQKPFSLGCPGLGGNPQLYDIGGVPYLMPLPNREKIYDMVEVCRRDNTEPIYAIGAGAGPWPYIGTNCEGIYDLGITDGQVNQQTRIASITDRSKQLHKLVKLPTEEVRCAVLANIFVSNGKPGKVLRIECKNRTGDDDYIASIRKCLQSHYTGKYIGLGGAFVLNDGRAKMHIMSDFSKVPLLSNEECNAWLNFFDMPAPIVCVGTLISNDPGLDLRVQHFHGYSPTEGGHYHIDTTPDRAHYIGYFAVADSIVRVDAPEITHNYGRD